MRRNKAPRRYAKALVEILASADEKLINEFEAVVRFFSQDLVKKVFFSPFYYSDLKKLIWQEISKDLSPQIVNFITLLIDKKRLDLIEEIFKDFENFFLEKNNVKKVKVITAFGLDEEERERLEQALVKKFGFNGVVIEEETDESLICGIRILIDDDLIDYSFATALEKFKNKVAGEDE